jgi:hypothetical protein
MRLQIGQKLKDLGFTINHYGLIGVFLLITIGLTFTTEPMLLQNLTGLKFLHAQDNGQVKSFTPDTSSVPPVSYDGIDSVIAEKNNLSSLIDPSFGKGSVLGLSTEAQNTVDNMFDESSLQNIPVNQIDNSDFNISNYIDQVQLLEAYYGDVVILSSLSSQDPVVASKTIPVVKSLISELKSVQVPTKLVRYHRLKLMHYSIVLNMLENIASDVSPEDKSAAGILFFEITNELESERTKLIQQSNFDL